MQHIKGKDTKIEVQLRKALWAKGYRYRKNYDKLSGRPDIVLTKYKIAIFCDGEFFHGKDWEIFKAQTCHGEKIRITGFPRLQGTGSGMKRSMKKLLFEGWTVIRFWGKDIQKNLDECVKAIEEVIFEIKMEPEEIGWEDMEDEIGK